MNNKKKNKARVILLVLLVALATVLLIKLNKPMVRIDMGLFFPSDVYGPQVAASKDMPTASYTFKVRINNVRNFSPIVYKEQHPQDIVMGDGWRSMILTNDAALIINEIGSLRCRWVRIELRGLKGELLDAYEYNYLGFL